MTRTETQKLSPEQVGLIEGLSVLTSEQKSEIKKYCERVKPSFERREFDGNLCDVFKYVFEHDKRVLNSISDSIHDEHCTKSFFHVPETYAQFEEFETSEPANALWNVNLRAACAVVKEQLSLKKLTPVELHHEEDLFEVWTNTKAAAGLINFGETKKNSVEPAFKAVKLIKKMIERGEPAESIQIPAQVFHRAQISGFVNDEGYDGQGLKMKDRFVWGLDAATVSIEGQYAKPLIEYLAENWFGYAGGKTPEQLRRNIRLARESKYYWLSIDYSKFDQTVPSWLIQWCFDTIKSCFAEEYHKELDWIAYNFINTKVAIPGQGIRTKHKGVPSGSNFTQIVGSMANAVMALSYIASTCDGLEFQTKCDYLKRVLRLGSTSKCTMFVMGDDNLMFTSMSLNLGDLSTYVHKVFGVRINPDKCEQGRMHNAPSFLKREWRRLGEYQDPVRLTVNVIHPERKRSYEGYSPWHIVYGLYLTYRESFPRYVTERWLVEQMEANGGTKALERIPRSDLPGVFRAFGDDAIARMVARAERLVKSQIARG